MVLLAAAAPRSAAAAPPEPPNPPRREPPVVVALLAGVATALFPLALGAMHTAGESSNAPTDGPRNVGFAVAGAGFALSPFVAHVTLGEWDRAAAFAAAPVASELTICTLLTLQPDTVFHGTVGSRLTFGILFTADVLGAAVGLVDVMMAGERAHPAGKRASGWPLHGVTLAPAVGRGSEGIILGGTL